MSSFSERVLAVVRDLPPGTVAAYGEVAAEAGVPGGARAVGRVLAASGGDLPWWRVVTAEGRLAPDKEAEQARHLAAEGVACRDGRVLGMARP
jgi:methylated-DNA-protein-cysteine methyltransferase-like protein